MTVSHDTDDRVWTDYLRTRDPALRNRLVVQYAPLVKYVAGRMRAALPESVDQDDLVSDGVFGLVDAIERFEPDRGVTFQTFAVPRIRGAIVDGMRAMDFVPRAVRDKLRTINRARIALEDRLGRTPEDAELASEAGVSVQQLRDISRRASQHASLDEFDLADELVGPAHHEVEDDDFSVALMRLVRRLSDRDQILIALYYYEGLTLAEIGRVLGVTESRVSQLHTRVTRTLRAEMQNQVSA